MFSFMAVMACSGNRGNQAGKPARRRVLDSWLESELPTATIQSQPIRLMLMKNETVTQRGGGAYVQTDLLLLS